MAQAGGLLLPGRLREPTSTVTLPSISWAARGNCDNVSAYDAMHVALAEPDTLLVTCDVPVANAPGYRAGIEVID